MEQHIQTQIHPATERLFAGGGECGALLAKIDWSTTELGPVESWPPALRTALRICLTSRHPLTFWWGPELIQLYNDAYAPITGQKHPWALGKPGREVWPEIWDIIGPMLKGVLRTGEATWSDDQLLLLERYGYPEECYFTYSYSPIEDEQGGVGGVFTAVTENTHRVIGARRNRLARDLAAALVDARTVTNVSSQTAQVLSTDPEDIPFALLYQIDPDGRQAHLLEAVRLVQESALAPQQVAMEQEVGLWHLAEVAHTHQAAFISDIAISPECLLTDPALMPHTVLTLPIAELGQTRPSLLFVAAVSPRRSFDADYQAFFDLIASHLATSLASAHAHENERQRAEALAAIDRAKTAFFSNVSHEFRTPLTLILGPLADMLQHFEGLPPALRDDLRLMQRNSLRLLKLVNTLLDFSRMEAGRIQASFVPTDLAQLTADLASSFRSLIEKAGLQFTVDCPPLPQPVYVDRDQWEKIVLNLISNAFKFTFTGAITVRLRAEGEAAVLEVSDTGIGIPSAELPRLFERFHRIEGARARTHEGSGIGLALVQDLVQMHHATINVTSAPGQGTTFTIRLPFGWEHLPAERISAPVALTSTTLGAAAFVEEAERWLPPGEASQVFSTSAVSLARSETPIAGARIILADDNADMREYLARLLGEQFLVEPVANGAEAWRAIQEDMPDLVLSDVMMPEMDGFSLLERLRGNPRTASLPVILLSARAGEEATLEGLSRGADDYLVKPFSAREVLTRVSARLEITRIRRQTEQRLRAALDALLNLGEVIVTDEPEGPPLADVLVAFAREVLGCEIVSLVEIEPETSYMVPLATVGREPHYAAEWFAKIGQHHVLDYYSPADLLQLEDGNVIIADVAGNTARGMPHYGTRTTIAAPLIANDVLCGILTFAYSSTDHAYSVAEMDLARNFAQMALFVLDREKLLAEREAARSAALAAEQSRHQMDEFLGIASHELRTPLTSIIANVQMSERQGTSIEEHVPELARRRLQQMLLLLDRTRRQLGKMNRLVGDLLDISRINAGKLEMRLERHNLVDIVREAVTEQRAAWPGRTIHLDLSQQTEIELVIDVDRIGQVVTNLLTNALKYSPEEQSVTVTLSRRATDVRVAVRDHGPGISAEQQIKLFERFHRVPGIELQSGSGVGLGLGLYICKTLVERHGGNIGVVSATGHGSTFWFTLPLEAGGDEVR